MSDLAVSFKLDHTIVAGEGPRVASRAGSARRRLLLVVTGSFVAHLGLLALLGLLRFTHPAPPSFDSIEVSLVDLPVLGVAGGGGGSAGPAILGKASAPTSTHPRSPSQSKPHVHHHRSLENLLGARRSAPVPPVGDSIKREPPEPQPSVASLGSTTSLPGITAGGKGAGIGFGSGTGSGAGAGAGGGSSGGIGSGGSGLRAIYAPVPSIPDDLRDEVMKVVATARFTVSHDGKVSVILLNPTEFSELNDRILATLRKWRFVPATKDGVAIDTVADVRLLITVN